MSKTITLETAQALKSAFDAAGIEVPETEMGFSINHPANETELVGWNKCKIWKQIGPALHDIYPAPDAEELGKWLPSLFAGNRLTIQKKFGRFNSGYYRPGIMMHSKLDRPNLAESLAALMIACLKADPDQIKAHLSK